jgi:hypothetical protein
MDLGPSHPTFFRFEKVIGRLRFVFGPPAHVAGDQGLAIGVTTKYFVCPIQNVVRRVAFQVEKYEIDPPGREELEAIGVIA